MPADASARHVPVGLVPSARGDGPVSRGGLHPPARRGDVSGVLRVGEYAPPARAGRPCGMLGPRLPNAPPPRPTRRQAGFAWLI